MKRCLLLTALALVLLHTRTHYAHSEDELEIPADALHPINGIAWSTMAVKILDPDGNPVEGAGVRPWALRAGNAHFGWAETTYGGPRRTTTKGDGTTNLDFPAKMPRNNEEMNPVFEVSLMIFHSDFCAKSAHVGVPPAGQKEIPTVTLQRGVRLRVAGVEPGSDRPLSHCHVMLEHEDTNEPEFTTDSEGWLQSIPVSEDRRWFRVVRTPPGEPPQFSKPQAWSPDDPASREVRVELRPGVRVTGKLSDEVTRPIEHGHVVAWCGSPSHAGAAGNGMRREPIWWIESATIAADGSFEFPSLPSGYLGQFYAIANDYVSAPPSDDSFETCCKWFGETPRSHETQRCGQILRLSGGKSQITLEMEPACQMRVKCVDPDGNPLAKIRVASWPNQYVVPGLSTIFCSQQSSLEGLTNPKGFERRRDNPFDAVTNANGEAIIRNIPHGTESLYAGNALWQTNSKDRIKLKQGETTDVELKMERVHERRKQ